MALGYIFTVESFILFVTAFGVFAGRKWGWPLALAISLIGTITSLVVLVFYGSVGAVPGILVNLIAVYLLTLSSVKSTFGRGKPINLSSK